MKLLSKFSKKFLKAKKEQVSKLKIKKLLNLKPKLQLVNLKIIKHIIFKQSLNLLKFQLLKLENIFLKDIKKIWLTKLWLSWSKTWKGDSLLILNHTFSYCLTLFLRKLFIIWIVSKLWFYQHYFNFVLMFLILGIKTLFVNMICFN